MARVSLLWVERPGLEGLEPAAVARAAGVELNSGGPVEAAVVTCPAEEAPEPLRQRLAGKPVQWLELAAEVGGGDGAHRLARAAAAVARAAGRAELATLPPVYAPQPAQKVLVAGRGLAALAAAHEAALAGHPVLLAGEEPTRPGADDDPAEVERLAAGLPAGVELASGCTLLRLAGAAGDFRAELSRRGKESFGAVVLAPGGETVSCEAELALDWSWVRPLPELLASPPAGEQDRWLQVALLAGVSRPTTAGAFRRAVEAARRLQQGDFVQVTLFFREARVASEGGERAYRAARQAGVLAVRVPEEGLVVRDGGRRLRWHDPLLDEDLELAPDVLTTAWEARAARPEFLDDPVQWPAWEHLLPDNPRFSGGRTAVSGLYILGPLRGTPPGADRRAEAAAAAGDLHRLLSGGEVAPMPSVRHTYCARCLTCVRTCPHHALGHRVDRIQPAPAACQGCGVCAAECPAEAIAPPGWSNPELRAGLQRGLALAPDPKLVVFTCAGSGRGALDALARQAHTWPAGVLFYPVPCAGRVGLALVLKALELGARGVLVAGCHHGNCRSVNGNLRAQLRVDQAARLLESLGLRPEAVRFLPLAANQPRRLARAVEEMAQEVAP